MRVKTNIVDFSPEEQISMFATKTDKMSSLQRPFFISITLVLSCSLCLKILHCSLTP